MKRAAEKQLSKDDHSDGEIQVRSLLATGLSLTPHPRTTRPRLAYKKLTSRSLRQDSELEVQSDPLSY